MDKKDSAHWTANGLFDLPLQKRLEQCPDFLRSLVEEARARLHIDRVRIFGSRARGDASLLSDYDLVFDIPGKYRSQWPAFVSEKRESVKTLLGIDWILFNQMSKPMAKSLLREGVQIYGAT